MTEYRIKADCERASNGAVQYIWGVPYDTSDFSQEECLVKLKAPDCLEAPWSRWIQDFMMLFPSFSDDL